jgi:hypothetical protein
VNPTRKQLRKRHHYIPQHALRWFADGDGLVWMYRRSHPDPVRISIKDAANEKFLYAPEGESNDKSDAVEIWLADNIDGPAAPILPKLVKDEELSTQEQYNLAAYLVAQSLRTPRARDAMMEHFERRWRPIMIGMLRDPNRVRRSFEATDQSPPTDEDVQAWIAAIDQGEYLVEAEKALWLDYLITRIQKFAPIVMRLPYRVFQCPPNHRAVIADSPLLGIWPASPSVTRGGWLSSSDITLPLSPEFVLTVGVGQRNATNPSPAWFRSVNSRAIRYADEFVFANEELAFISKILNGQ